MKKASNILFLLCLASGLFAQEHIDFNYSRDFDRILESSKIDTSQYYFPRLYQRFVDGDASLTNYEVLAMQIGYTDNDKYWPYQDLQLEREIWKLNEEGEFKRSIRTCDKLLGRNPFSLLANREKSYALSKLGKEDRSTYYFTRFEQIAYCIVATGNGLSYETSMFVLSPADGQWVIRLLLHGGICSMGSGSDDDGNFHDVLGYQPKEGGSVPEGNESDCIRLHFNIEHAANRMFGKKGTNEMEKLLQEK